MGVNGAVKFCTQHWERLRTVIEISGLSPFVAKNGAEAVDQVVDDLNGTSDQTAPYDPLMAAHWMIASNALKSGGIYMMAGDYCPLCELEKYSGFKADDWILPCCESLVRDFMAHGWVKEQMVQ